MLFRKEVIEKQSARYLGDVLLYSPPSFWGILSLIAIIMLGIVSFAVFGEYARKERVVGVLMPSEGLVRITPPQQGSFEEVYVNTGETIEAGSPLFKIKNKTTLDSGVYLTATLLLKMESERLNLKNIQANIPERYKLQKNRLKTRKKELLGEAERYNVQTSLHDRLVELEKQRFESIQKLFTQEASSKSEVSVAESNYLQTKQNLNNLRNTHAKILAEIKDINAQLSLLPVQQSNDENEIKRRVNELEQNIARTDASDNVVIRAPIAGTIASLIARKGQQALPRKTAVSILPKGGKLQAELYVPTRAIAFVKKGQSVRLRYDAFPYQKFGIYNGVISEISKTVIQGTDLVIIPEFIEPFFLVIVDIDEQTINAFDDSIPLQAGISLSADIILEDRKLWEWAFEPLIKVLG